MTVTVVDAGPRRVSRSVEVAAPALSATQARSGADALEGDEDTRLTAAVLRVHAGLMELRARQAEVARRFERSCPGVPVVTVATQPADVHDVDGLRVIGGALAGLPA